MPVQYLLHFLCRAVPLGTYLWYFGLIFIVCFGNSHVKLLLYSLSGPSYGFRGKVLLTFEGNGSSKIGVRFEKSIPDGNDLGGLCEEDHGFFCSGDFSDPMFLYYCFNAKRILSFLQCSDNVCHMVFFHFAANHLIRIEGSGSDDVDRLAIGELFEVCLINDLNFSGKSVVSVLIN